jgi:hypothetical protein
MPTPFKDESDGKTFKRVYWPRGDADEKRRQIRREMESQLARQGKKRTQTDKKKALDERWGEYCETQRSLEERNG